MGDAGTDAGVGCGVQILQSFLEDPEQAPDTSCIAEVPALDFTELDPVWLDLIGIDDLWENP